MAQNAEPTVDMEAEMLRQQKLANFIAIATLPKFESYSDYVREQIIELSGIQKNNRRL